MEGLLVVPTRLCTGARLAVHCDQSAALSCLEKETRLQQFEVNAARASVSGVGLTAYANDGVARNVIRVTCMDCDGELAGAFLKDVVVVRAAHLESRRRLEAGCSGTWRP